MNCPSCKTVQLSIAERAGVEIDFCPTCRGVWLDRGELDKIIAKAMAEETGPGQPMMPGGPAQMGGYAPSNPHPVPPTPYGHPPQQRRYDDDNDDSKYGYKYTQPDPRTGQYPHYQKPKKPFWKELFDF